MRILLTSLKFNTGHLSSIAGWKRLADLAGHDTVLYLDKNYVNYLSVPGAYCVYDEKDLYKIGNIDVVIIINLSLKDSAFLKKFKKTSNAKVIFIHHEPWCGWRIEIERSRQSKFIQFLLRRLAKRAFGAKVLKCSDLVVCPSNACAEFYKKNESHINKNFLVFPLIYPDEMIGAERHKKEFFSFIAYANGHKAFSTFIKFVKYASKRDDHIRFQIATKTDITSYIDDDLMDLQANDRLIIQQGRDLTVDEINAAYDSSICTWLAYKSSTQSGVIFKTFMVGSPCVASNIGVFGEQVDGNNGILLSNPDDLQEIYEAYLRIKADFQHFSVAARKSFEKYYLADTFLPEYKAMLKELVGNI